MIAIATVAVENHPPHLPNVPINLPHVRRHPWRDRNRAGAEVDVEVAGGEGEGEGRGGLREAVDAAKEEGWECTECCFWGVRSFDLVLVSW